YVLQLSSFLRTARNKYISLTSGTWRTSLDRLSVLKAAPFGLFSRRRNRGDGELDYIWSAVIGYLVGSIPIGFLVVRQLYRIDIRRYGSGNIGFTNVFRTAGLAPGLVVLAGDSLKGVRAVRLGRWLGGETAGMLGGLAAIAGHNWSLFLRFSGGRGVATGAGVFLALAPKVLAVAALIWVLTVACTRYVSLGSILGAISVPISV